MKKVSFFALMVLLISALPCYGSASNLSPYVGIDGQNRYTKFVRSFGDNEFQKNYYLQGNVFLGLKFNNFFGAEVGYFNGPTGKLYSVSSRNLFLGQSLLPNEVNISNTKARFQGFNLSPVVFLNIFNNSNIMIAVGVTYLDVKLSFQPIATEIDPLTSSQLIFARRDFSKNKYIAHAKFGLEHLFSKCFGIRGLIGWENTKRFKLIPSKQGQDKLKASLKDSVTLGLGIILYF